MKFRQNSSKITQVLFSDGIAHIIRLDSLKTTTFTNIADAFLYKNTAIWSGQGASNELQDIIC